VPSIEPFQLHLPFLEELDVGTTGHEVAYHAGYEYLASESVARDPRRVVHGGAEELVGLMECVARMESYPDAYRWRTVSDALDGTDSSRSRWRER
jgi:hypothetical protein